MDTAPELDSTLQSLRCEDKISSDSDEVISEHAILRSLRCLQITFHFTSQLDTTDTIAESMRLLFEDLVLPAITSEFAAIQEQGIRCLGVFCITDKELATKYVPVLLDFVQMAQGAHRLDATKVTAAGAVSFLT